MPNSNLKLFRRHEKQCSRAYPKEYRIYEWMTETQKGKTSVKDCSCSIYSEGTLVNRHGSKTIQKVTTRIAPAGVLRYE